MRASAGVSALARTPRSRVASAQSSSSEKAPPSSGGIIAGAPAITSPRVPSRVMSAPSRSTRPSGAGQRPRRRVEAERRRRRRRRAARGRGRSPRHGSTCRRAPSGRRARRACRGCPRGWSRAARGSSARPAAAAAWAASAVKTMRPVAAPGLAARPRGEDVARRRGVDLRVQVLDQAARLDAEQRLPPGDDAGVGEVDRDADGGAGVAADRQRVEDGDAAVLEGELELAGVAEAAVARSASPRSASSAAGALLQRRGCAPAAAGQRPGVAAAGRRCPAPRAGSRRRPPARRYGRRRAAGAPTPLAPGPDAERQPLHDQAEAGALRRALGLAQDARRGGVPRPGHGAGRGLELLGRVLRPGLAGLRLEERQHVVELARGAPLGSERRGGRRMRVEVLGVEAVHSVGEARRSKRTVEAERRGRADPRPRAVPAVRSQRPRFSIALAPPQARSSGLQRSASRPPAASAGGSSGIGPPAASAATQSKDSATPGGTGRPRPSAARGPRRVGRRSPAARRRRHRGR